MQRSLKSRLARQPFLACTIIASAGWSSAAGLNDLFSKNQAELGAKVFEDRCASCHGAQLEGGDHGPPLKDDAFWQEWSGKTARSLYSRIISTMPPDDAGSLAEKDVIEILAHFAAVNGAELGARSLERADELNNIKLERPK
jgi:cytochrome c5